jgi:hypothetical protein
MSLPCAQKCPSKLAHSDGYRASRRSLASRAQSSLCVGERLVMETAEALVAGGSMRAFDSSLSEGPQGDQDGERSQGGRGAAAELGAAGGPYRRQIYLQLARRVISKPALGNWQVQSSELVCPQLPAIRQQLPRSDPTPFPAPSPSVSTAYRTRANGQEKARAREFTSPAAPRR